MFKFKNNLFFVMTIVVYIVLTIYIVSTVEGLKKEECNKVHKDDLIVVMNQGTSKHFTISIVDEVDISTLTLEQLLDHKYKFFRQKNKLLKHLFKVDKILDDIIKESKIKWEATIETKTKKRR